MAGKAANEAKQRYITANEDISIQQVCDEFSGVRGCAYSTLLRLSADEGWPALRAEFRANAQDKALARMSTKASYDVQKSLERTRAIEDKAYNALNTMEPEKFGEAANTFFRANEHSRKISGVDPKLTVELELGGLVDALNGKGS